MDLETTRATATTAESETNLITLLRSAATQADASRMIVQALVEKLSKSLAVPTSEIDVTKPIYVFGVDSLVAVEIRYWFLKAVNADVRVMDIMSNDSVADLCDTVAGRSQFGQPDGAS